METILEPLVRSPKFLGYLEELNEFGRREAEARARFRALCADERFRAEFINGEVVKKMVARDSHNFTVHNLERVLGVFVDSRRLGCVRGEQALTVFKRNEYAPDICFWRTAKAAELQADTSVYPIPDFIVEVLSRSTESNDRSVKFEDYAANGVGEYWIVDPDEKFIEQYIERQGRYELKGKFAMGEIIRGVVISGLEMPVGAAFEDEANLVMLREILRNP